METKIHWGNIFSFIAIIVAIIGSIPVWKSLAQSKEEFDKGQEDFAKSECHISYEFEPSEKVSIQDLLYNES